MELGICGICHKSGRIIKHHLSYDPEILLDTCNSCHFDLHHQDIETLLKIIDLKDKYSHLWGNGKKNYSKTPRQKELQKNYRQRPKAKARIKRYDLEHKEDHANRAKRRYQRSEVKAYHRNYYISKKQIKLYENQYSLFPIQ